MPLGCPSQNPNGVRDTNYERVSKIPKLRVWQCLDLVFESFTVLNRLTQSHRKKHPLHLAASQISYEELDSTHQNPSKGYCSLCEAFTQVLGKLCLFPKIFFFLPMIFSLILTAAKSKFKLVHFLWVWITWAERLFADNSIRLSSATNLLDASLLYFCSWPRISPSLIRSLSSRPSRGRTSQWDGYISHPWTAKEKKEWQRLLGGSADTSSCPSILASAVVPFSPSPCAALGHNVAFLGLLKR